MRKESQLEQAIYENIVRRLLAYGEESAGFAGTMRPKQAIGPGSVDVALAAFRGTTRASLRRSNGMVRR